MFCTKCGREVPDDNRFCEHCGAPMTPAEETPAATQPEVAPQPAVAPVEETIVIEDAPVMEEAPAAEEAAIAEEVPVTPVEDPGASTAKTAFILGLVGLIAGAICSCGCALLGGILPLICSVLAIVFANQAKQKSAAAGFENQKAKTAMILGIAGIAVIVVFVIINMIVGAITGAAGAYESFTNSYSYYT